MTEPTCGLTLLDKPVGVTSFNVLGVVKRALGTRKVGHAGTLDKFATGLLAVLSGPATKVVRFFTELPKTYEAVFRFGVETDTLDPEGRVVSETEPPAMDRIDAEIHRFIGRISQRPPEYSAVHVDGERAYRLARRGALVAIPQREIEIFRFDLLQYDGVDLRVFIRCSSGTYVRSLARDLGRATDSAAHVIGLRRTSIGPFLLESAVSPHVYEPERHLIPFERFMHLIPGVTVSEISEEGRTRMHIGRSIDASMLSSPDDSYTAVFDRAGRFLGVLKREGARYEYVFNRGAR